MSLRLLLNENFPAPSVALWRQAGFDLVSTAESRAGIDDMGVPALALRERRCVVTFDRNHGELIFARRCPAPPAVILLEVISYPPEEPDQWGIQLVTDENARLGRFTVLDQGGIRRSRPLLYEVDNGAA